MNHALRTALGLCLAGSLAPASAQEAFKLSKINGGVGIEPEAGGGYGRAVCSLGDLDGDGVEDLAVGEPFRDDGGQGAGAVWIHFRRADGTVRQSRRISATEGGIQGLVAGDAFGTSLSLAGDRNGDGVMDLFVGAPANDGGGRTGRVFLLYLDSDGSVVGQLDVGASLGPTALFPNATFGESVCAVDDVDGDGIPDLAVAGTGEYPGLIGPRPDGLWVVFLGTDGAGSASVRSSAEDFVPAGLSGGLIGRSMASPGDLDGDGVPDLALGDPTAWDFFLIEPLFGYVHVLFLGADGGVQTTRSVRPAPAGFPPPAHDPAEGLGTGLAVGIDGDQNGLPDLLASTSPEQAFFVLSLGATGQIENDAFVSPTLPLRPGDGFGTSLAVLQDQNGDGLLGLAVGTPGDDDGGPIRGAVWIANEGPGDGVPNQNPDPVGLEVRVPAALLSSFGEVVSVAAGREAEGAAIGVGDLDGDGTEDLAWGLPGEETDGPLAGVVFLLFMAPDGSVVDVARLAPSTLAAGLGIANPLSEFGSVVAPAGDRDGNGVPDLLVRALEEVAGQPWAGYFTVLLAADGSVVGSQWVRPGLGGFQPPWITAGIADSFASSLVAIGDMDGDGRGEIAAGSPREANASGVTPGAVYVLFTQADESVASFRRLKMGKHGLPVGEPFFPSRFGEQLASLSDLNGDGRRELVVTLPYNTTAGTFPPPPAPGALVLFLAANGVPTAHTDLSPRAGLPLSGESSRALTVLEDWDGDGREELVVESGGGAYLFDLDTQAEVEEQLYLFPELVAPDQGLEQGVGSVDLDADGLPELLTRLPAATGDPAAPHDLVLLELERVQTAHPIACPGTTAGSLVLVSGQALLGERLTLALDNPAGTQSGPAVPILFFGSAPLACGSSLVPGWGMAVPGTPGELLVDPFVPPLYLLGPLWAGAGPVTVEFALPHDSGLVGARFALQGLLWEPAASQGVEFALTEAVEFHVRLPLPN